MKKATLRIATPTAPTNTVFLDALLVVVALGTLPPPAESELSGDVTVGELVPAKVRLADVAVPLKSSTSSVYVVDVTATTTSELLREYVVPDPVIAEPPGTSVCYPMTRSDTTVGVTPMTFGRVMGEPGDAVGSAEDSPLM